MVDGLNVTAQFFIAGAALIQAYVVYVTLAILLRQNQQKIDQENRKYALNTYKYLKKLRELEKLIYGQNLPLELYPKLDKTILHFEELEGSVPEEYLFAIKYVQKYRVKVDHFNEGHKKLANKIDLNLLYLGDKVLIENFKKRVENFQKISILYAKTSKSIDKVFSNYDEQYFDFDILKDVLIKLPRYLGDERNQNMKNINSIDNDFFERLNKYIR